MKKQSASASNVCKNRSRMRSDLKLLADETFDLLIVGAGIHGVCAARAAARLGLKTALVDCGDFGSGTSANSLKVIHGGLRYLQHGNVRRMRESIRARRRFLLLAPNLVRPQPFAVPTRGVGMRSKMALRVAMALNDLVSLDRNAGLHSGSRIPAGRVLSAGEAAAIWPMLPRDSFDGAAVWHDALCHNTERLTLKFALEARAAGATLANYVRAERLIVEGGAATGVEARDGLSDASFAIRARAVLNTAGPWWERWARVEVKKQPLVGAWNLVVRPQWFGRYGVGLESEQEHRDTEALVQRGRRNLFFAPWRGGTLVGTVYEPFAGDPAEYRPARAAIESFIREINSVVPGAQLGWDQISLLHIGVQPAAPGEGSPEPDKHSEISLGPVRNFFVVKGVKYTTGLTVGERAACAVAAALGRSSTLSRDVPTVRVSPEDVHRRAQERNISLPPPAFERLAEQYGEAVNEVLDEAVADRGATLYDAPSVLRAEIRHAVKRESAVRLADVVLRRTDLGTFEPPLESVCRAVAGEMAPLLAWSPERREAELADLRSHYSRLVPGA
ncbi:MAG: FAD-dependent oxidoreductase [Kiritimatiellae bacterium]|nr:FAD-dependent oxidoreductase [Kiritimatiellia bacterium]